MSSTDFLVGLNFASANPNHPNQSQSQRHRHHPQSSRGYWKFCVEANTTMFLVAEKAHPIIQTYVVINPTRVEEVSDFIGPINEGDRYGARYRGYLCVPVSRSYKFFIASDDYSELFLSTTGLLYFGKTRIKIQGVVLYFSPSGGSTAQRYFP